MKAKALPHDETVTAPTAIQDRQEETGTKSPQAFYEKMAKRPDVREILTRLAKMDQEETR